MIDLKQLREQPEEVIAIYRDRLFDEDAAQIARKLIDLDTRRRQIVATSDDLKQQRNTGSAAVGREKDPERRKQLIADMEGFKGQIAQADQAIAALDEEMQKLLLQLPNLPDPSVPAGKSDAEKRSCASSATSARSRSRPSRIGISGPSSASSTSSGA
jgi:seryl-tRNA synthetase